MKNLPRLYLTRRIRKYRKEIISIRDDFISFILYGYVD